MGAAIGNGLLNWADDLAVMGLGLIALMFVIEAIILAAHLGGDRLAKVIRPFTFTLVVSAIFLGSAHFLAQHILSTFKVG